MSKIIMAESKKAITLEEEYNKKTGITPNDIAHLRQWLSTQPHLPGEYITELDLILAYHCCNHSQEVTKQLIDAHYTMDTLLTGYFENRQFDSKIEQALNAALITPLPTRGWDESAVIYCRLLTNDVKQFDFELKIRTILMVFDLWQSQEGTWPGLVIVVDFNLFSLGHLAKIDLTNLRNFLYYLQETIFVKLKGLHFINAPSFINKLLLMMRPFMKKELMDALQVHTVGSTTLEKYLPMDSLPVESGDKGKTFEDYKCECIANLKANPEFFELNNKKRVNEAKRPGKRKTISDIFGGVEGSFKRLDID